jgi:hypothetical protein
MEWMADKGVKGGAALRIHDVYRPPWVTPAGYKNEMLKMSNV